MTSTRAIVAIACVLAVSACGGIARPLAGSPLPPSSTDAAATETSAGSAQDADSPAKREAGTDVATQREPVRAPATTSTTGTGDPRPTPTTQSMTVDLGPIQDALDELDGLFGAFESQLGSIDLEELEEGETP